MLVIDPDECIDWRRMHPECVNAILPRRRAQRPAASSTQRRAVAQVAQHHPTQGAAGERRRRKTPRTAATRPLNTCSRNRPRRRAGRARHRSRPCVIVGAAGGTSKSSELGLWKSRPRHRLAGLPRGQCNRGSTPTSPSTTSRRAVWCTGKELRQPLKQIEPFGRHFHFWPRGHSRRKQKTAVLRRNVRATSFLSKTVFHRRGVVRSTRTLRVDGIRSSSTRSSSTREEPGAVRRKTWSRRAAIRAGLDAELVRRPHRAESVSLHPRRLPRARPAWQDRELCDAYEMQSWSASHRFPRKGRA